MPTDDLELIYMHEGALIRVFLWFRTQIYHSLTDIIHQRCVSFLQEHHRTPRSPVAYGVNLEI